MDPRERLRMALSGAGCTRCGQPYTARAIRVLAQREEIAFVQLVCFGCQTQTLALVTRAPAAADDAGGLGEGVQSDRPNGDDESGAPRRAGPTISEADVLEMRSYLAEYEGDVRGLFDGLPGEGEPGDGATDDGTSAAG